MSTRAAIARLTCVSPVKWAGRYHHWDGYPSGLGTTLWKLYHGHFNCDLDAMLKVLLDDHPAGWSSLHAADFDQQPGFAEPLNSSNQSTDQPQCYCHGDRQETEWLVTDENASGSGCEWAYAFTSAKTTDGTQHNTMLVLSSYTPEGKMIGYFGVGNSEAVWPVVAVVDLNGTEPNWEQIETAKPLDPMFPLYDYARRKSSAPPYICRDWGRRGTYQVRLAKDKLHYVSVTTDVKGKPQIFCTCSAIEDAQSPDCAHSTAVLAHLETQHATAKARQQRDLEYSGSRVATGKNQTQVMAIVWEAGQPRLLDPKPSQQLHNHSPSGFEWGYGGSGPAQLALAMLLDFSGDEELALNYYQAFKSQFIASLSQEETRWTITGSDIAAWLQQQTGHSPDL